MALLAIWRFCKKHYFMPVIIIFLLGLLVAERTTGETGVTVATSAATEADTAAGLSGTAQTYARIHLKPKPPVPSKDPNCPPCPQLPEISVDCGGEVKGTGGAGALASGSVSATGTAHASLNLPVWGFSLGGGVRGRTNDTPEEIIRQGFFHTGVNYRSSELFYQLGKSATEETVHTVGAKYTVWLK